MVKILKSHFATKLNLSLIVLLFSLSAVCQDSNAIYESDKGGTANVTKSPNFQHHHLSLLFGFESSKYYSNNGNTLNNINVPVLGLNYTYWLDDGLGFGINSAMGLSEYEIYNGDTSSLKRNYPISVSTQMLFNPMFGLLFYIGPGVELDKHKNLFVFDLGIGYRMIVWKQFYVTPEISYTFKESVIGAYGINVRLGLRFGK